MDIDKLPIRDKFSITVPGEVTIEGRKAIKILIRDTIDPLLGYSSYFDFPNDWIWTWVVTKGEYAGTLPKRISKLIYEDHQISLPPACLTQIGNIAKQNSEGKETTYIVDFTDQFDWYAGDFGDSGSCYWGDRSGARDLLQDNDGMAMRIYMNGHGFGRCWMVPNHPEDGQIIIFNCYPYNFQLITMARLLSSYLGLSYKRINLSNNECDSEMLYINGGAGYLIGKQQEIEETDSYDFGWGTSDYDYENYDYHCAHCGDGLNEDDACWVECADEYYCETCRDRLFNYCERCGEYHHSSNHVYARHGHGWNDQYWCDDCADEDAVHCDECGDLVDAEDSQEFDGRIILCFDCYREKTSDCQECGKRFWDDDLTDGMCTECKEEVEVESEQVEEAVLV